MLSAIDTLPKVRTDKTDNAAKERAQLVEELNARTKQLENCDVEITTAERTSAVASAALDGTDVQDAAGLIEQRNHADDLLKSYLRPQRVRLAGRVEETRIRIQHLDDQERADRAVEAHDACCRKLREVEAALQQDITFASLHTHEIARLSAQYARINETMNELGRRGCTMSTLAPVPTVGFEQLLDEWRAQGLLQDWVPTVGLLNRLQQH